MSNLNPRQFALHEVSRMHSGDFPGHTMAGMSRLPLRDTLGMRYDHKDLRDLTQSVREHGVHTPLKAMMNDKGKPEIIDGTHRYLAARRAGASHVPVEFLDPHETSLA